MSNRQRIKPKKPAYSRPDVSGYPGRGERNVYECNACGGRIVVIHTHEGVTPMFLACRATEACRGQSYSLGYPPSQWIDSLGIPASYAWTLPSPREFARMDAAMQGHIQQGGLMLAPLAEAVS